MPSEMQSLEGSYKPGDGNGAVGIASVRVRFVNGSFLDLDGCHLPGGDMNEEMPECFFGADGFILRENLHVGGMGNVYFALVLRRNLLLAFTGERRDPRQRTFKIERKLRH